MVGHDDDVVVVGDKAKPDLLMTEVLFSHHHHARERDIYIYIIEWENFTARFRAAGRVSAHAEPTSPEAPVLQFSPFPSIRDLMPI